MELLSYSAWARSEMNATCMRIEDTLEMLQNKTDTNPPKKHGNIPL
jgi:hypothetical protein